MTELWPEKVIHTQRQILNEKISFAVSYQVKIFKQYFKYFYMCTYVNIDITEFEHYRIFIGKN